MRTTLVPLVLGVAGAVALAVPALGVGGGDGRTIVGADVLAPLTEPYTGAANAIRGIPGGALPWQLRSGSVELRANGELRVRIRGLVFARRDPVPANLQGTNPFAQFEAIVSCRTTSGGAAAIVKVVSRPFAVTPTGDGDLHTSLGVPSPCFAPIVFVASPTGAWFAATGR